MPVDLRMSIGSGKAKFLLIVEFVTCILNRGEVPSKSGVNQNILPTLTLVVFNGMRHSEQSPMTPAFGWVSFAARELRL